MSEHVRTINNVVLVGLSGSGKSTVGRYLATRLNLPLYDTDALIEAEAGRNAADIFASEGEAAFRQRESAVLNTVLAMSPAVIATGGGIVTVPANTESIRKQSFVVWLDATTSAILTRITGHRQPRPLLQVENPYERLEHMRQKRASLYRGIADLHMLTDGIHANAVAVRIAMLLPPHLDQSTREPHE